MQQLRPLIITWSCRIAFKNNNGNNPHKNTKRRLVNGVTMTSQLITSYLFIENEKIRRKWQ